MWEGRKEGREGRREGGERERGKYISKKVNAGR